MQQLSASAVTVGGSSTSSRMLAAMSASADPAFPRGGRRRAAWPEAGELPGPAPATERPSPAAVRPVRFSGA